jgi:hypothetical protein
MLCDQQRQTEMINELVDRALELWGEFAAETKAEADEFLGSLGYILIQLMLRFQYPSFIQEDEWRVLLIAWAEENQNVVHHRYRNEELVPYVDWGLRPEYLEELLIGPGSLGADEPTVRQFLATCGLGHL